MALIVDACFCSPPCDAHDEGVEECRNDRKKSILGLKVGHGGEDPDLRPRHVQHTFVIAVDYIPYVDDRHTLACPFLFAMTSDSTKSMRYQQLLHVIDKALQESRKSFDTSATIQECYGDDASIFGVATLSTLLDSLVDRVNDKAKQDLLVELEKYGVKSKLEHVEDLIRELERLETERQEAESTDRQSATTALEKAKLPEGISPADIVSHRASVIMKKERDGLIEEIRKVEGEIKLMEQQIAQAEEKVNRGIANVEATGAKLERTADACSFVS